MKLEPREKRMLIFGGIAAVVILLYTLVLAPLAGTLSGKRGRIPQMEKDLVRMKAMREQYVEMQQRLREAQAAAEKRGPLLTEIENITKRANLSGKVVSLKPQPGATGEGFKESIVEIRMENLALYDIVNYVHLLEKSMLRIKKLYFKPRFDNPNLLNSTIVVSSAE
ncbi:MAG: hypothetical protein A2X56_08720 [Nitrospirae bacterium GWC2_57_13]|nr:MAG: hypothetical protein A2X56_08720 [Nitrospirae bacterium GWC2_57_13]HAS53585.1 hypothetical protein [Nitrospiraceae bacterium]